MQLIATDLDHTLLGADGRVSPRTRNALDRARAAGIAVVPVTARQPIGLRAIAEQAGFDGWSLCSNGALGVHLTTGELLFTQEAPAEVIREVAAALDARIPGLVYASVRGNGDHLVAQAGYGALAHFDDHKREPAEMGAFELAEVLAAPSLKLVVRHAEVPVSEIYAAVSGIGVAGFAATLSGAPFVEIMAEGVTKASGLARMCAHLGVEQSEVVAFGDGLNDIEMLEWAGHGVAMGNAADEVRSRADEVAPSNAEDGVARVIERLLG
ncbi:HAD family phosphatase [Leucobacter zeae]|nr:HAD family phosphatase [Leucobacter zeae]